MADAPPHVLHVAMPFARAGSAVTTVIRELVRCHSDAGGKSSVVLSDNRDASIDGVAEIFVDHREVCPREYFTRGQMYLDHAFGIVGLARPFTGRLAGPAIRAAKVRHPDVVVVHEGHYATSTLARWRAAFPAARIVLYVHTPISRAYGRRELSRLLSAADDVVCVSDFVRRQLQARTTVHARTHSVLNGAMPGSAFQARTNDPPQVLFVGQLAEHKGALLLAQALAIVAERGVDFRATFAGSSVHGHTDVLTPYERQVQQAVQSHAAKFDFLGYVEHAHLEAVYRGASLVCMPSVWDEPCGLVLLEAMSAGAAVLASSRGGIPEVGADSVAYCDPTNIPAFAEALERLILDERERRRLGERAFARARELAWPRQYVQLMEALGF